MPSVSNPVPEASSSVPGITEYATTGEAQSGAATDKAMTPANLTSAFPNRLDDNLGFNKVYTSPAQTITTGGTVNLSHGLGAQPKIVQCFIQCVTAELGYSVGDRITVSNAPDVDTGSAIPTGVRVRVTTSQLQLYYGNQAAVFKGIRQDTGAYANLNNAKWRLYVNAWA